MNIRARFLALAVIGVLISTLVPALMVQAQGVFAHGAVVALQGTPHLWIADQQGILHWAGDTRALSGRHVRWDSRIEVALAQLQGLNRGDPWLSAGLLKDGDPIYLVKWETEWPQPRLFHIQSSGTNHSPIASPSMNPISPSRCPCWRRYWLMRCSMP